MAETALITGGSGGIGAAMAEACARRGLDVMLVGRDAAKLAAAAARVGGQGRRAFTLPCPLTDEGACRDILDFAHRECGTIRWLVHCAGNLARGPLRELEPQELHDTVFVNLTAPIRLSQLFWNDLATTQGGLLFVASTAGRVPWPFMSLYAGTKHGLIGFAEALRYEGEPLGMHVAVAFPPMTSTAMTAPLAQRVRPGEWKRLRLAEPEPVGEYLIDQFLRRKKTIYYSWLDRGLCAAASCLPAGFVRAALRTQRSFFARLGAR